MRAVILIFCIFISAFANFSEIFPKPKDGFKRHIINLEKRDDKDFRIEVHFGKDMLVDCNHHFFIGGNLKELELKGWGYRYYEFDYEKESMAGTKMMCHEPKQIKFIKFPQILKLNYNSKLPLVIYTKDDLKLEISIFKKIKTINLND